MSFAEVKRICAQRMLLTALRGKLLLMGGNASLLARAHICSFVPRNRIFHTRASDASHAFSSFQLQSNVSL